MSTPFPKFRAGTGYANHEFSIDQNFQFALFELIESPPTSVESEPKDTDIIQAIHRSKPSQRDINHQREFQISFSNFSRSNRSSNVPGDEANVNVESKNRHGLTENYKFNIYLCIRSRTCRRSRSADLIEFFIFTQRPM